MPEPFEKAEKMLDELESDIKSRQMRDESLVVVGQCMANLLKDIDNQLEGDQRNEARELVMRWEKEFK